KRPVIDQFAQEDRDDIMIVDRPAKARRHGAALGPVLPPALDRTPADMAVDKGAGDQRGLVAACPGNRVIMDGPLVMGFVIEKDPDLIAARKLRGHAQCPSRGSVAMASLASMAAI